MAVIQAIFFVGLCIMESPRAKILVALIIPISFFLLAQKKKKKKKIPQAGSTAPFPIPEKRERERDTRRKEKCPDSVQEEAREITVQSSPSTMRQAQNLTQRQRLYSRYAAAFFFFLPWKYLN